MVFAAKQAGISVAVTKAASSFQRETKEKWTFLIGACAGVVALGAYVMLRKHQKESQIQNEKEGKLSVADAEKLSRELHDDKNLDTVTSLRHALPDLRELNEQGNKAFERKAFQQAIDLYTQALQQRATITSLDSAAVLSNRALAHISMGRFQYAFADAIRSCTITRNCWAKSLWILSVALERLDDSENAVRTLSRGLQLIAEDGEMKNRFEEALATAQRKCLKNLAHQVPTESGVPSSLHFCPPPENAPPMPLASNRSFYEKMTKGTYPIEVRETEGRGRGLFVTRRVAEGSVLWVESPVVSVSLKPNTCDHCLRPFSCEYYPHDPVICPHSGVPYCSVACQSRAWDSYQKYLAPHAEKISNLKKEAEESDAGVGVKIPLLAARIVAMAIQSEKWPGDPTQLNDLHHLNPRHERLPPFERRDYSFMHVNHLYTRMLEALEMPDENSFVDATWFDTFAAIVAGNGFGISDTFPSPDYHLIGNAAALYRVTPMLHHSCKPNAEIVIDIPNSGNTLTLRATRRILKNEQITVSYVPPQFPVAQRTKMLETLGVICTCPRCLEELADQRSPSPTGRSPSASSPASRDTQRDSRNSRGSRR